jgi:hypothetical protein
LEVELTELKRKGRSVLLFGCLHIAATNESWSEHYTPNQNEHDDMQSSHIVTRYDTFLLVALPEIPNLFLPFPKGNQSVPIETNAMRMVKVGCGDRR